MCHFIRNRQEACLLAYAQGADYLFLVQQYPTFPKWGADWREGRLNPTAGQAIFALSGVCGRAGCWNRADRTGKPLSPGPGAVFFSAADRPV